MRIYSDTASRAVGRMWPLPPRSRPPSGFTARSSTLKGGRELAQRPPLSVGLIKQCIVRGSEIPLLEALRLEQDAFWKTMQSDDARRLMRAYLKGDQTSNER